MGDLLQYNVLELPHRHPVGDSARFV